MYGVVACVVSMCNVHVLPMCGVCCVCVCFSSIDCTDTVLLSLPTRNHRVSRLTHTVTVVNVNKNIGKIARGGHQILPINPIVDCVFAMCDNIHRSSFPYAHCVIESVKLETDFSGGIRYTIFW